ncbi:MAG: hypothetical protein LC785_06775 [Acidobacteria bacterium]|nr:hypothetical protein [Acidobacteriota bacterium]
MPNGTLPNHAPRDAGRARARRVLVCESSAAGAAFASHLAGAGYEVQRASADTVRREIENFAPQLLVVEFDEGDDAASVALRAGESDARVPLVVVYGVRVEAPRDAARECRAEDCFVSRGEGETVLREAHDFFRLNLRRVDAVAFYGPDLLVAHLPRRRSVSAREDLLRLCHEFDADHAPARIAAGVACAPEDGTEVEELIERAQASLEAAREPVALSRVVFHSTRWRDARGDLTAQEGAGVAADGRDADGTPVAPLSLTIEDAPGRVVEESAREPVPPSRAAALTPAPESSLKIERGSPSSSDLHDSTAPAGARNNAPTGGRALRESRRGGESFETSVLPQQGMAGGGVLPKSAAEAALREREMRAAGVPMPRRVLLTVSDPARMAQVNLLLRSASYEVRAAFDGGQALGFVQLPYDPAELLAAARETGTKV